MNSSMAYIAPLGAWGSYMSLFVCILITVFKNWGVFVHNPAYGNFDYKTFITAYLGIPLYLMLIFGAKFYWKTKRVRPAVADFYSGKVEIDRDEERYLASQAERASKAGRRKLCYRFISWLL
jgi:amino acid transporter